MRRFFLPLYILLTTPMPVPWSLLAKGSALILAFSATLPFEAQLATLDLTPLKLAMLVSLVVTINRNVRPTLRQFKPGELTPTVLGTIIVMVLTVSTITLVAPSDAWLQHAMSLGWVFYGMIYALILVLDRSMFSQFNWLAQHWPSGQANAARWMILRYFGLATANEFAISHFSKPEWVVTVAILPALAYALFYWSVLATHPYKEDA